MYWVGRKGGRKKREEKKGGSFHREGSQEAGRKRQASSVFWKLGNHRPAVGLGLCCGFRGLWQELRSGEIGTSPHLSRGSDSGVSTPKPGRVGGNSGHPQRAVPPPE